MVLMVNHKIIWSLSQLMLVVSKYPMNIINMNIISFKIKSYDHHPHWCWFHLPVSRMTNLLSSKRRSAWALESTFTENRWQLNLIEKAGHVPCNSKKWIEIHHHGVCGITTLQSKNPLVDSDLSFLKALPILHGTWWILPYFHLFMELGNFSLRLIRLGFNFQFDYHWRLTSRSIARSENLKVPGLAFRMALAVILSFKLCCLQSFKVSGLGSL